MGYDEDEIQAEFSRIEKIVEGYKKLSPKEKESSTISLDELLNELDDGDEKDKNN